LCFFQEETHTRSITEIKKAASSATF
jgi:hypothetical protein